tara:strand:+ start:80 stop:1201 length:1122 start_codon:yes stop_codon:yes gene_type:complete
LLCESDFTDLAEQLMDIFTHESLERVGVDNVFVKLERLIDWVAIGDRLGIVRHRLGRKGYDVDAMVRVLLLGQWHSLSDRELEHALRVRLDFMLFCGFDLYSSIPDHSTICRFRCALVEANLHEELLCLINAQLEGRGVKVSRASTAVVDATIIESSARPRKWLDAEKVAEDRLEPDLFDLRDSEEASSRIVTCQASDDAEFEEHLSVDGDARWLKKGHRSYFGYKCFSRVDESGFVEKALARPANEGEQPHFPSLVVGSTAERIMADKGMASAANRQYLKAQGYKDGIMHRAARNRPLTSWQKVFNRLVSKKRWIVEQSYGTMKRRFDFRRASYRGRAKVEAQMTYKAVCANLLKAANMIVLTVTPGRMITG